MLTCAGWVVVGAGAVLVEPVDQRPGVVGEVGGGVDGGLVGQVVLRGGPYLRGQPPGGGGGEFTGEGLHVPQARRPGGEHPRGRGKPRWQGPSVEPDPRTDLFGDPHPAAGLAAFPPEQIGQRGARPGVAAFGEGAPPDEIGDPGDRQMIQPPRQPLAHGERGKDIVGLRAGIRRGRQQLDRSRESAVRERERAAVHGFIVATPTDNSGRPAGVPAEKVQDLPEP